MYGRTQVGSSGGDAKQTNRELSNGCSMYDPCPICFKCQAKATHLYARCEDCPVQFCGHSHKHRSFMIKRSNFAINVTDETGQKFLEASENLEQTCTCNTEGDTQ